MTQAAAREQRSHDLALEADHQPGPRVLLGEDLIRRPPADLDERDLHRGRQQREPVPFGGVPQPRRHPVVHQPDPDAERRDGHGDQVTYQPVPLPAGTPAQAGGRNQLSTAQERDRIVQFDGGHWSRLPAAKWGGAHPVTGRAPPVLAERRGPHAGPGPARGNPAPCRPRSHPPIRGQWAVRSGAVRAAAECRAGRR
ncbi:hypothetical protein OG936_05235 [Streptomyces sp. NBC_00846]|nr:hypothetical protein OG936_05235 [Streptomyces sp. NBC_00846]